MTCSAKYLENSLFYEPWKTKYIESFCPLYAKLKIKSRQNLTSDEYKKFIFLFFSTILNIFYFIHYLYVFPICNHIHCKKTIFYIF